eukprot:TRINITY_DN2203_c0_g2_i2.p1 TRINITY_DN2203_c0_g2~~TRINITY_DN2203_c0_g2_i2.p1  ORF type:complete len:273 (-),score=96.44 TRINITY_DN2203_c0_g2_i2:37-855(-)
MCIRDRYQRRVRGPFHTTTTPTTNMFARRTLVVVLLVLFAVVSLSDAKRRKRDVTYGASAKGGKASAEFRATGGVSSFYAGARANAGVTGVDASADVDANAVDISGSAGRFRAGNARAGVAAGLSTNIIGASSGAEANAFDAESSSGFRAKFGVGVETGASIKDGSLDLAAGGTGVVLGKKLGVKVLGTELSVDFEKLGKSVSSAYTDCSQKSGCHHGYCWSGCAGAFPTVNGPEWCYTRKTKSGGRVKCSSDSECSGCWQCDGSCTVKKRR